MRLLSAPTRLLTLSISVLLLLFSCKTEEKPLTTEEAKQFAKELEISVEKRDPVFFNKAMDRKELTRRAGITGSKSAKQFSAGVEDGMNMGDKVIEAVSKKATYQLVKHYEKDKAHHLIFRLYDGGSINYHDLELKRNGNDIKIADMFVYTSGETLSETIKNLYKQISGLIEKSSGDDAWIGMMPKIRQKINEGEFQEAYDLYNELPDAARNSKAFRIIYIQICSNLGDDLHKKALDEFLAAFPNEPNMQLLLMDAFFMNKEYDKLLNAINAIDKMIDKDPFLDYYRYLCYNVMEDQVKAKEYLLATVKNYPDFPDAQLELIATYLEEGDYAAAKPLVESFQKKKTYEQTTLEALLQMYPDFKLE